MKDVAVPAEIVALFPLLRMKGNEFIKGYCSLKMARKKALFVSAAGPMRRFGTSRGEICRVLAVIGVSSRAGNNRL